MRVAFTLIGGGKGTGGYNYLLNLVRVLCAYEAGRVTPVLFFGTDVASDEAAPFDAVLGAEVVRSSLLDRARRTGSLAASLLAGVDAGLRDLFRSQRIDVVFESAQFFGWRWGKRERPANAARFTLSWLMIFALSLLVVMTGFDPVKLTEYSVIFSVVALPLTYLPILLVANDHAYMGAQVNGRLANFLGVLYFILILAIALAAIPLMLLTHGGQG